ncbi:MAG: EAL domain-containing protein, partial [Gemmatimonadota bacterium]
MESPAREMEFPGRGARLDPELGARMDAMVMAIVRPAAVGLAAFYAIQAISYNAFIPLAEGSGRVLTGLAALFIGFALTLGRWQPEGRGHLLATVLVSTSLIGTAAQTVLSGRPETGSALALLVIGAGILMLSLRWLSVVIVVAVAAWAAAALASGPDRTWLVSSFNLAGAVGIAIGAHFVRVRAILRTERLRRAALDREQELTLSQERYALSVAGSNDGLYDWDLASSAVYCSPRFKAILGYGEDELDPDPGEIADRVHPDDAERVSSQVVIHLKGLTPHFEDEFRILHRDGTYRWVLMRGVTIRDRDGRALRMAGSMTDMTGRGVFDPLTALPNRVLLQDRLQRAFARNARHGSTFALLFIDLDRFKLINDSYGHQAGDELLLQVARRLQASVRTSDTVARLGGDEFVVILEDVPGPDVLDASIERIKASVLGAYRVADRDVFVSASIGAVLDSGAYDSPEDILRDADTAMYQSKQKQHSLVVFDVEMREEVRRRLHIENELRRALAHGQFHLLYQPITQLQSGDLFAVEALARWEHPARGVVSPAEFIPVMEEIGLIVPFGAWALLDACMQVVGTGPRPDGDLSVSVNLSGSQLRRPEFVDEVADVIEQSGIQPHRLFLEITESAIGGSAVDAAATLRQLKTLGVRIMMDDFGTGHSSLSALHSLPIDCLKIDRSFVARMPDDRQAVELVRAMVVL